MPPSTAFDEPSGFHELPEFDVGDRVVATHPAGPWWHRVRRGTAGMVVARTTDWLVAVRFDTDQNEHVHRGSLAHERPGAG